MGSQGRGVAFMPSPALPESVIVVDITCPDCGRTRTVQKVALGEYRCVECEASFSPEDVGDTH